MVDGRHGRASFEIGRDRKARPFFGYRVVKLGVTATRPLAAAQHLPDLRAKSSVEFQPETPRREIIIHFDHEERIEQVGFRDGERHIVERGRRPHEGSIAFRFLLGGRAHLVKEVCKALGLIGLDLKRYR